MAACSEYERLLEPLSLWLEDSEISEIMINQPGQLYYEKAGCMHVVENQYLSSRYLHYVCRMLANINGKIFNTAHPLCSGQLPDGSRIQLVGPPVTNNPVVCIRRFITRQCNFSDIPSAETTKGIDIWDKQYQLLLQQRRFHALLCLAVKCRKTIVIAGATSSGKTTCLQSCLGLIDPLERICVLQDTPEIRLDVNQHHVELFTSEKPSCVDYSQLIQASLRLRPDRIIVGEIRGKEMLDFITAASTGHSGCMTTVHANSAAHAWSRMLQLYKMNNVPAMTDSDILQILHDAIDMIVFLKKHQTHCYIECIEYRN